MTCAIEPLSLPLVEADLEQLAALLVDCVQGGASIGFMAGLSTEEARTYWREVAAAAAAGRKVVLLLRDGAKGPIVGSAQLALESRANGRHRAEVQKVLVLRSHRRRGLASALMRRIEAEALRRDVTLLFLDTSEGPGGARAFYHELGYTHIGGIPGYALDPDGKPAANAIFYKPLTRAVAEA